MAKVSIIIPTREIDDYVKRCIWHLEQLPEEKEIIDQSFNNKAFGKFYRAVHAVLQKNPPRHFFNLSDILQERKEMVYTDWCHLSEEGNEIVARRIVKIFRKEFLK